MHYKFFDLMKYQTFFVFNVVGGFVWSFGFIIAGYFLGRIVPGIDQYILPIALLIIIISVLPGLLRFRR